MYQQFIHKSTFYYKDEYDRFIPLDFLRKIVEN